LDAGKTASRSPFYFVGEMRAARSSLSNRIPGTIPWSIRYPVKDRFQTLFRISLQNLVKLAG
jgi:hypothetical protein